MFNRTGRKVYEFYKKIRTEKGDMKKSRFICPKISFHLSVRELQKYMPVRFLLETH